MNQYRPGDDLRVEGAARMLAGLPTETGHVITSAVAAFLEMGRNAPPGTFDTGNALIACLLIAERPKLVARVQPDDVEVADVAIGALASLFAGLVVDDLHASVARRELDREFPDA